MNLATFKQQLHSHANPVIVDLWAPWCVPCRVSKPILESLAKEYEGRVDFLAINADEHSELLGELKIFGIPTVLLTRAGEIVSRQTGSQPRESYRLMFEALTKAGETAAFRVSAFNRFLRLFAGSAIGLVGLITGAWFLIAAGGVIAFLGIYDRCPVWRALTTWFTRRKEPR